MEEFLLVCLPAASIPEDLFQETNFTTPDGWLGYASMRLLDARSRLTTDIRDKLRILNPVNEHQLSFPLFAENFTAPRGDLLSEFFRSPFPDLILDWGTHFQGVPRIEFRDALRPQQWQVFERAELSRAPFNLPKSCFTDEIGRRMYVRDLANRGNADRVIPLDAAASGAIVCLYNPLIIRLSLAGNELDSPSPDSVTLQNAMHFLSRACDPEIGGWMLPIPILDDSFDLRITARTRWSEALAKRGADTLSRIERFLGTGGKRWLGPSWLPFFALDQLEHGEFRFRTPLERVAREKHWRPTEQQKPNAHFFAKAWSVHWGGELGSCFERPRESADRVAVGESFGIDEGRPQLTFRLSSAENEVHRSTAAMCSHLVERCRVWAERVSSCPSASRLCDKDLLEFAATVMRTFASRPEDEIHRTHVWLEATEDGGEHWQIDILGFIKEFCRLALAPSSSILVEFPDESALPKELDATARMSYLSHLKGKALDLLEDVQPGMRLFAELLHGSIWKRPEHADNAKEGTTRTTRKEPTPWDIPLQEGWWRTWYCGLFNIPANRPLRFVPARKGLIIGHSIIGEQQFHDAHASLGGVFAFAIGRSRLDSDLLGVQVHDYIQPEKFRL